VRRHFFSFLGAAVCGVVLLAASGRPRAGDARLPELALPALDGKTYDLRARAAAAPAPVTVLIFYSAHCACFAAHREAIRAVAAHVGARRGRIFLVASEPGAPGAPAVLPADAALGIPILIDAGGALARALGAEFATFSVVFDGTQTAVYRGGIDSARTSVGPDAKPYLLPAVEAVLAGRAPERAQAKTLGCTLKRW
jgi:hypothetical protein